MGNWQLHWKSRCIIAVGLIVIDYLYGLINSGPNKYPMHYVYLGLIDGGIFFALPKLFGKMPLIRDLQRLNYCAVIAHFYGFCIYILYFPPLTYNVAIYTLAVLQYLRLIWINKNDRYMGWYRDSHRYSDIRHAYIDLSKLPDQRGN
jgi:hypothetical protein